MKLSVIVPTLDGKVPAGLRNQVAGRDDTELVVVAGVSPVGKARNEGLRRATGEYVAWVDGDDEVADCWLRELDAAIRELDDAAADAILFDARAEGWKCLGDLAYGKSGIVPADEVVRDVYADDRLRGHLWRTVTRRRLWEGLSFDETIPAHEDFLILPQVLRRARRILCVPQKLYRYVYRAEGTTSRADRARVIACLGAALRRWREAPPDCRASALAGSLRNVYQALLTLKVDPRYRGARAATDAEWIARGTAFVRRHAFAVKVGWHERMRYVCAGLGFWWPQRLARKWRS